MDLKKINWFGLAGGIALLFVIILSSVYAVPWWQLSIGKDFGQLKISPLNFGATLLGLNMAIPIILVLNLTFMLLFIASAIAMILYSLFPGREYAKNLLGFAYKKPLIILILFVAVLFILFFITSSLVGIFGSASIPIAGTTNVNFSPQEGIVITIPVTTGFTWNFWFAVMATALCVAARIYHSKIAPAQKVAGQKQ